MAKKGERVGAMGDSVYYRTPDGQIVDDSGNVVKGPLAKMLADEYESKQKEKAKAQAEAKAAAEEAKRQKAAERAAETARKAAERQAAAEAQRQQAQAERDAINAQKEAERQAAIEQRQQKAAEQRAVRASQQKQTTPAPAPAPASKAPTPTPAAAPKEESGMFKKLAIGAGKKVFDTAFPTLSSVINKETVKTTGSESGSSGDVRQVMNRVADEVNVTNMMLQTSIARQETTNQILGEILKEVKQIKKPSLIDAAADALGNLGNIGAGAKGKEKTAGKVAPKSGLLGAAGSALRRAPLIGSLIGGGLSGYDEYQESGNAGRAISTGAGAAAGGGLGAWGGASAGAALGAFGGPVGMAIGGLLGAVAGGIGGSWLGGKAGKGVYDAVATPSEPKAPIVPEASKDIKEARETAAQQIENAETSKDSVVNVKTLTFNADNIIFNNKNQQNNVAAVTPALPAGNVSTQPIVNPPSLPPAAVSVGPAPSADIRNAIATAPTTQAATGAKDFGISQIQAARSNATSSSSFYVSPGVRPAQGAMAAGAQTASIGSPENLKLPPNATAVQLASSMVGKSRMNSLDYLKAGGFDNKGEAWCAEFVNSTLKQSGASGSGSAVANSFQSWGTAVDPSKVQAGDVVLQTRGKGSGQSGGHVGIATGVYQHGQVEMIAGNTSGAVRKYFVAVNNQLMVRRGGGTQLANAEQKQADPTVGGTPGAITPSTDATSAKLSPKETAALGAASGVSKSSGDPTSRKFDSDGKRIEPATGGMKRMNPETGKFEEIPKTVNNDDPYLKKIKSPLADLPASTITPDVIKKANDASEQASKIPGPKQYNTSTGKWEPYQLNEQPKYEPAKILEPKPITKGAELNRSSTQDMVDQRSAKTGITVNQQTTSTPQVDASNGKFDSSNVGIVEPVDARTRLKELFGIG